jgi:hypothetical protein
MHPQVQIDAHRGASVKIRTSVCIGAEPANL